MKISLLALFATLITSIPGNAQSFCAAGLWMNGTITNIGKQCNQINYNDLANLPPNSGASQTNPALITPTDWGIFNGKQAALGFTPLNPSNNLSDLLSASAARTNLGLGTAATQASGAFDASGAASTAQTAAQTFAANGSNISSGTIAAARIATLNQSTTGNAATATALAATPTQCSSGAATGVAASGNANCASMVSLIGYTPENVANRAAANGYAPLNGSSVVPFANLPTIPSSQTSGFAAVATAGTYASLTGLPTIPKVWFGSSLTNASGIASFNVTSAGFSAAPVCSFSPTSGTVTANNSYNAIGNVATAWTATAVSAFATQPISILIGGLGVGLVGSGVTIQAICTGS